MKTKVIFRRFTHSGDLIALFPEIPATHEPGLCASYQHIGQHGAASVNLSRISKPASIEDKDVQELVQELELIGYDLEPRQRVTFQMDQIRLQSIRDNSTKTETPSTINDENIKTREA